MVKGSKLTVLSKMLNRGERPYVTSEEFDKGTFPPNCSRQATSGSCSPTFSGLLRTTTTRIMTLSSPQIIKPGAISPTDLRV